MTQPMIVPCNRHREPRAWRHARRALTLIDMMITTMVLGIIVAATVPVAMTNQRTIVLGAVRQLTADLEYAQVRSITQPTQTAAVCVLNDGTGYYLADAAALAAPIDLPEGAVGAGDPYAVTFGGYRATNLEGVQLSFVSGGEPHLGENYTSLEFDEYGRLSGPDDVVLQITFADSTAQLRISALTGSVRLE